MEIGHVFEKNGIEYCICDIKKYGNHDYAYALSGDGEESRLTFFQLENDEQGGTLLRKIVSDEILAEIMPIFVDEN